MGSYGSKLEMFLESEANFEAEIFLNSVLETKILCSHSLAKNGQNSLSRG